MLYKNASIGSPNASLSTSARLHLRLVARIPTATTPRRLIGGIDHPRLRGNALPSPVLSAFSLPSPGVEPKLVRTCRAGSSKLFSKSRPAPGACPPGCLIVDATRGGHCEWQNQDGTTGPARAMTPIRITLNRNWCVPPKGWLLH